MLLKTMNNKLVRDNSHKWGEFLEVPVTERFIMRSIRIFDGGKVLFIDMKLQNYLLLNQAL